MTVREALTESAGTLKKVGIETSSLDASLLLAQVLGTNRTALASCGADQLSQEILAAFQSLIDRRKNGECTAYILGKKEFRGLEFFVNPSVLVPRPDTETLVEAAIERIRSGERGVGGEPIRVLDLCTGSGAIAVALKHEMPALEVWATDISAEALETAKANAARLLGDNSINFYLGDLFEPFSATSHSPLPAHCSLFTAHCSLLTADRFSLIVCNPPYIPSDDIKTLSVEVQKEPRLALDGGKSGLETIKQVINGAPDYLSQGGMLLMEADPRQMKDIAVLLEKRGFSCLQLYKDMSDFERVIGGVYE
ncbi:MAG: peptide chain release factor N(5)-glutamine methyltransferase [Treponema sp.]|jgi:release factor glutamine methyltransferase|nr:peptide chain release factor N(5)-glutamine methyltransferase [Treponema sp.]